MVTLATSDERSGSLADAIVGKVTQYDLDGILIDCTEAADRNGEKLEERLDLISSNLHRIGKTSWVMVPGNWRGRFDKVAAVTDLVLVQLFDSSSSNLPHPWRR